MCDWVATQKNLTQRAERRRTHKKEKGAHEAPPSRKIKLLFCGGLRSGVLLLKALHTAGSVDQLLLSGEKRMAIRANFHAQHIAFNR